MNKFEALNSYKHLGKWRDLVLDGCLSEASEGNGNSIMKERTDLGRK